MNEIKNMFKPNIEIYQNLKDYIKSNASVETYIARNKISNKYPLIVFEEARNELNTRSTTYDNTSRLLNYNINIYCSNDEKSLEIVNELVVLLSYFPPPRNMFFHFTRNRLQNSPVHPLGRQGKNRLRISAEPIFINQVPFYLSRSERIWPQYIPGNRYRGKTASDRIPLPSATGFPRGRPGRFP